MHLKKLIILIFLSNIFTVTSLANEAFLPIYIINRGHKFLHLTSNDFLVSNTNAEIKTEIIGQVRWERTGQNLLIPWVTLRLRSRMSQDKKIHYRYKEKSYFTQQIGQEEIADLNISTFDSDRIEVFMDGHSSGHVEVKMKRQGKRKKTVIEDYSCSGYNVEIFGFEGEFMSIGCELIRETIDGQVIPTLKVHWVSNEFKTLDLLNGPYTLEFSEGRSAVISVINERAEKKEITFMVDFPTRIHRLNTAVGLGPYLYKNEYGNQAKDLQALPSFMLYGNYYLNNVHSLKFFEALVMKESVFNHAGLYVGSEIGKFYDDRLVFSTLLGLQALSYRFDSGADDLFTQMIYPQGVEITMHHPWDLEKYKFVVGGFVSPQSDVTYQNFWLRFGSKVFVELNYINWQHRSRAASMYGVSIGMPLFSAF